jgi:hypothetical protein
MEKKLFSLSSFNILKELMFGMVLFEANPQLKLLFAQLLA